MDLVSLGPAAYHEELARRVSRPQRHRLLQGYPMLPLMRSALPAGRHHGRDLDGRLTRDAADGERTEIEPAWIRVDTSRPLLVGIIPHAQCTPKIAGCGFCTFPHDAYDKGELEATAGAVGSEMMSFLFFHRDEISKRRVDAVYFGGGTANLTPPETIEDLGGALADSLDMSGAEVTLEGVPSLFRSIANDRLSALLTIPARQRRISMGVQTFDQAWISRMGRQAFGSRRTVEAVVDKAHRHDVTASGDFLINLPGQRRAAMIEDLRQAEATGLDQICVYHLVLTESTGARWADDPEMMRALPAAAAACDNWLAVRDWLLEHGFVQTTLTNFERASVHATSRRFVYEEHSFSPERYDAIGFGPMSISTFVDLRARRAVKHVCGKILRRTDNDALFFAYGEEDLRLLHLTRTLARLAIDRAVYRAVFGDDPYAHFGGAIDAVVAADLATLDDTALRLTPRGMFFADSIAGLFAFPRVEALRAEAAGQRTRDLLDRKVVADFMG